MALLSFPLLSPICSVFSPSPNPTNIVVPKVSRTSVHYQPPVRKHEFIQLFTSESMASPCIGQLGWCHNSKHEMSIKALRETEDVIVRRSANYQPPIWNDEFIQSLNSEFKGETYRRQINQLKEEVKTLLGETTRNPLEELELIDTLQRLGISYHFEREINEILERRYKNHEEDEWKKNDLYATSLEFRLLREHGFDISEEVFIAFKDEMENFGTSFYEDINGILSLYEASFLSKKGENILEAAKCFAINHLKEYIKQGKYEVEKVIARHVLDLPLHWRIQRLEARWFIDVYKRRANNNPLLLETAKLDFNMVQYIHQEDFKYTSSWWESTKLGEKLNFARYQLMENFLWTIGIGFEPEFGYFRRMCTKIVTLITLIDDIYDVYGTFDELKLFTNVIERWDISAMDQLPEYMKDCFFILYDTTNKIASKAMRDHGVNVQEYLKKVWVDLCQSYLREANWYYSGYKPTFKEYMENAWISVSGPVILVHSYVLISPQIIVEDLESLIEYADIIRWSSTIMRLANDLLKPLDEQNVGDVPKSIQCYMNETGVSENDAREYIRYLIDDSWKKLNEIEDKKLVCAQTFIKMSKNLARVSQCIYQYGGHAIDYEKTEDYMVSLLVQGFPLH